MRRDLWMSAKSRYIEPGSTKVRDKLSDAIAYLYASPKSGRPGAQVFFGKQSRPVLWANYKDAASRDKAVAQMFESRQRHAASIKNYRDERNAYVNDYRVGDVLYTSWGYDQTNVEFFEVTGIKGRMVTLREIGEKQIDTGPMQGRVVPLVGEYVTSHSSFAGKELTRLAQKGAIKIDDVRRAYRLDFTEEVPGVRVYASKYVSSYH